MLLNLSLLLERWAGGGSRGVGCRLWGEPCSERRLGLLGAVPRAGVHATPCLACGVEGEEYAGPWPAR